MDLPAEDQPLFSDERDVFASRWHVCGFQQQTSAVGDSMAPEILVFPGSSYLEGKVLSRGISRLKASAIGFSAANVFPFRENFAAVDFPAVPLVGYQWRIVVVIPYPEG